MPSPFRGARTSEDDISEATAIVVLGTEFTGAGGEVLVVDVDVSAIVEDARNDVEFDLNQSRVRRVERAWNLSNNFGVLFTNEISAFEGPEAGCAVR